MRKIVRGLEIISDEFENSEDLSEMTQLVKISNFGNVRIVKLDADGKIISRQRIRIDKSVAWRIFDLIDENFELTTNYPENFDYGFWTLRTYYNKTLTGEYRGPLMNLDNLGELSNALRALLDREDLNFFDGQGKRTNKKNKPLQIFSTSAELVKSYLSNSLQRNKVRIALISLNDKMKQVYCQCDDRQIVPGMLVWARVNHQTVVGKVSRILFIKADKLPADQNQINMIISKY